MWSIRLRMYAQVLVLLFALFASVKVLAGSGKAGAWGRVGALLVLMSAVGLMMSRDTFLPFLGFAALPPAALLTERVPDAADGSRVIYWGAGAETAPGAVFADPWSAYADFANTGVAAVRDGLAKVRFVCPSQYKVGGRFVARTLDRHLHYRVCCAKTGMIGPVQTKYVTCGAAALKGV